MDLHQTESDLISLVKTTPDKISQSCDGDKSPDVFINLHGLIPVSVLEDDVGNPEHRHLKKHIYTCFTLIQVTTVKILPRFLTEH